jgi:hypothetical protein
LKLYGNFLFDDIKNSRFTTKEYLSYAAVQGGIITQMSGFPMEVGGEVTAVGPSTYTHATTITEINGRRWKLLAYTHDEMMLGPTHGSNFLSFAGRIRFHFPHVSFGFLYENVQQGDIANHPTNSLLYGEREFLANNISRKELFRTNLDIRLIPELHLFARYEYNKLSNKELHFIFSGAEFKY